MQIFAAAMAMAACSYFAMAVVAVHTTMKYPNVL